VVAVVSSRMPAILGLGLDLVEISRVSLALERWGARLVEKLMDPDEAAALPATGPERALAVARAVAAKEAASKAIGTGWSRGVRWRDVVLDTRAEPRVTLHGRAAEVASRLGSTGGSQLRFERHGDLLLAELRLLA